LDRDLTFHTHAPLYPFDVTRITQTKYQTPRIAILAARILPSFLPQGMSCIGNTNIPVTSLRDGRTFLRHRQQTRLDLEALQRKRRP
jgi:hypothetical protein